MTGGEVLAIHVEVGEGTFSGLFDSDVVNQDAPLVVRTIVADGDVTRLTGIAAQVNRVMMPVADLAAVFTSARSVSLGIDLAGPDGREVSRIGVTCRGDSHAKLLQEGGAVVVGPEANATAKFNLRRNQVVVR